MKVLNPYRWVISTKNFLYDQGWTQSEKFQVPVISVGNLTTGGTGKTPIVLQLIDHLTSQGRKNILVISKSYKASLKGPAEVKLDQASQTDIYGDEPCLIKKTKPQVLVWSGPHKTKTLQTALEFYQSQNEKIDVVIVDDGFSHRKIARNLDIVLVDVSQRLSHYHLIPLGHLREDIDCLLRADLVILTKTNNADSETLEYFHQYLAEKKQTYIVSQAVSSIDSALKNVFLFSGIGNPSQLETNLKASGFSIVKHLIYPDHTNYSLAEQKRILSQWKKEASDSQLCTTEKDLIKLSEAELLETVKPISLKISFNEADKGALDAKIRQIF